MSSLLRHPILQKKSTTGDGTSLQEPNPEFTVELSSGGRDRHFLSMNFKQRPWTALKLEEFATQAIAAVECWRCGFSQTISTKPAHPKSHEAVPRSLGPKLAVSFVLHTEISN